MLWLSAGVGVAGALVGTGVEWLLVTRFVVWGELDAGVLAPLTYAVIHGVVEGLLIAAGVYAVCAHVLIRRVVRLETQAQACLADPEGRWKLDSEDAEGDEIDRLRFALGRLYNRLRGEEGHLKELVDDVQRAESRLIEAQSLARMGSWEYTPEDERPTWTRQVYRIFGHDPQGPAPRIDEHLKQYHIEDRMRLTEMLVRSQETGGSFHGRFRISPTPGMVRWVENHGYCRLDETGRVTRIVGTCQDVTEQVEREETLARLTRELNHRVKNNLGSVLALIGETQGSVQSVDDFAERLTGRVRAMALVHETATASDHAVVDLAVLIERMLAPHVASDRSNLRVDGPKCAVTTAAARPLALTLHELANNAKKHGALSEDGGRLEVEWRRSTEHGLMVWWRERLDRPREIAIEPGVGMGLARGFVEHEIAGAFHVSAEAEGVSVRLGLPPKIVRWPVGGSAATLRSA